MAGCCRETILLHSLTVGHFFEIATFMSIMTYNFRMTNWSFQNDQFYMKDQHRYDQQQLFIMSNWSFLLKDQLFINEKLLILDE